MCLCGLSKHSPSPSPSLSLTWVLAPPTALYLNPQKRKESNYAISTLWNVYICTVNVFYFDFIMSEKETTHNHELWIFWGKGLSIFLIDPISFNVSVQKTIKLWTVAFFYMGVFFFYLKLKYLQKSVWLSLKTLTFMFVHFEFFTQVIYVQRS